MAYGYGDKEDRDEPKTKEQKEAKESNKEVQEKKENEQRVERLEKKVEVDSKAADIAKIPYVGAAASVAYKKANAPEPTTAELSAKANAKYGSSTTTTTTTPTTTTATSNRSNEVKGTDAAAAPAAASGGLLSGAKEVLKKIGVDVAKSITSSSNDPYITALADMLKGQALGAAGWTDANTARKMLDAAGTNVAAPNQKTLEDAAKLNYTPWATSTPTAESQWRAALGLGSTGDYNTNKFAIGDVTKNMRESYRPTVKAVTADQSGIKQVQNQYTDPNLVTNVKRDLGQYASGSLQDTYSNQTSGVAYNDLVGNEAIPSGPQTQAQINMRQALDAYRRAAGGEEPSVAQIQQQRGMEQAQSQQQAILAGKDFNAASLRTAQQNIMGIQQEAARSSAELRAKEMETARAGWAGLSESARGLEIQNAKNRAEVELARDSLNMKTILDKYAIDVDEKTQYDLAKMETESKARFDDAINKLNKYGMDMQTAERIAVSDSQVRTQAALKEAELLGQKYQVDTANMIEIEKANQAAQVNNEKTRVEAVLAAQSQENQRRIAMEADKLKAAGMSAELALKAVIDGAGLKIDADFKTAQLEMQKRAEIYKGELQRVGLTMEQINEAVRLKFGGELEQIRIKAQADIEKTRQQLQREVAAGNISQQEADRTLQWVSTGIQTGATAYAVFS